MLAGVAVVLDMLWHCGCGGLGSGCDGLTRQSGRRIGLLDILGWCDFAVVVVADVVAAVAMVVGIVVAVVMVVVVMR